MRYMVPVVFYLLFPTWVGAQQGIATHNSYIRGIASGQGDSVGFVNRGDTVEIVGATKRNGYMRVHWGQVTGWMRAQNVSPIVESTSKAGVSTFSTTVHTTKNPASLAQCGLIGDAPEGTPDALSNRLKRNVLTAGAYTVLSFIDFQKLEASYEGLFALDARHHKLNLTAADRTRLRNLPIIHGNISEGDRVAITGYLVPPDAHANLSGESVNCHLKNETNNDYHITIAASPTTSGYAGVVVEMIPQYRENGWTISTLKAPQNAHTQVLVVGQLFLDMEHLLNDDGNHPKGGQPPRFSLFEIHPVAEFFVCNLPDGCIADRPQGWAKLGQ